MTQFNVYIPGTTKFCTFLCTSLFILLFIKSTVYCIAHFHCTFYPLFLFYSYLYLYIYSLVLCFIFLHCPLSGPVLIYMSLLIISCIIEYVTNKRTLNPEPLIIERSLALTCIRHRLRHAVFLVRCVFEWCKQASAFTSWLRLRVRGLGKQSGYPDPEDIQPLNTPTNPQKKHWILW